MCSSDLSGTALSIVGGNVIAKNGAYIPSPSSRLAIIATASAGEVAFDPVHPPDEINLSHFLKLGAIRLLQGAAFDTSGDPSGLITLDAADVVLRDLAALIAFNNGDANGKGMVIRARTEILISAGQLLASLLGNGDGGSISLTAPTILLLDRSTLATESYAAGHAGNITLTADRLEIREAAEVTASTDSSGDGGDIFLNAKLALLDFSTIRSISLAESQGRAGDIYVDAKNFQVTESVVSTRASGTADGGNIFVTANNVLINRPRRERVASGLFASCTGGGAGGNITINAGNSVRLDDGQIEANAVGNGGNVHITAPSLVYLKDSKISASSDSGNGGNVLIDPIFVVLQNSQVLANALAGNGGNITILSDYFLSQAGTVDASAGPAGIPGSVTISSPRLDLTETVPTLLAELLDAEAQLQPGCAVRLPGNVSTFTTTGRGGTPFRPDDLQPAPLP